MTLGRVLGSVVATRRDPTLDGLRILLVQPVRADGSDAGPPFAALDTTGAGPGERVLVATSTEAGIPFRPPLDLVATDATIVGIVDPERPSDAA